jgi:hypothetical protein
MLSFWNPVGGKAGTMTTAFEYPLRKLCCAARWLRVAGGLMQVSIEIERERETEREEENISPFVMTCCDAMLSAEKSGYF